MHRRKETITLADPRALRALAHPARQRLVTELFGGRVLTATEAAEMVGLTPSAVSHHLRALERWGLARRAPASGDARERPWQGTARNLNLKPSSTAGSRAALETLISGQLAEFAAQLQDFLETSDDDPWRGSYHGLSRGELWLTHEETQDLTQRVDSLISEYSRRRTPRRHARTSRRTAFTWSMIPIEPAPLESPPG